MAPFLSKGIRSYIFDLIASSVILGFTGFEVNVYFVIYFQVKGKLHSMHLSVIRIFSSFIMSSAMIAGRAVNFGFIDDKIAHLTARILVNNDS